jgi:hypothetical protein
MLKIDSTGNLMIVKTDDSLVALLGNRYVELTFMKRKFNSGLGLLCLTPLSAIFQLVSWLSILLMEKTTDLLQVTDKFIT